MGTIGGSDPFVVVITGVMAAGKSTVARLLAERLPKAACVPGDVFRRMIVSGRLEMTPEAPPEAESQLRLRYRLAAMTADAYVEAGFTAVVQDIIIGRDLGEFVGLVKSRPLYVVVLAPGAEAVAAREAARSKTGYADWSVEELVRALHEDTPRIGLWIDSSRQTPEQTVEEILSRARNEAGVGCV